MLPTIVVLAIAIAVPALAAPATSAESLHLVVMDPLAAPLSCPCVEGYAQRKYEKLAEYLSEQLGREVTVSFGESLSKGIEQGDVETAHIIIGKDSVVRADAEKLKIKVEPVAQLTGKEGSTTQTGLIVVRSGDSAQTVEDLSGYRILYGPPECDEKFAAPRKLLREEGIELVAAEQAEISTACSDGACKIIEWGDSQEAAAVISSYAAPLLEGCGTINKGDLRVLAETEPVPFITAFVNTQLPADEQKSINEALIGVMDNAELVLALETLQGFVPLTQEYKDYQKSDGTPASPSEPKATLGAAPPAIEGPPATEGPPGVPSPGGQASAQPADLGWTGWRGPHRDGRVRALPTRLPEQLSPTWQVPLAHAGLGGIAATDKYVVIGDRNLPNTGDEFRCYDAATGDLVWIVDYPAEGHLDYDNTPRATPLIYQGTGELEFLGARVLLLGAFGDLICADLSSGVVFWQKNLREEYDAKHDLVWGYCSSPFIADGKLIANPGGPTASLVALDLLTGLAAWQAPGREPGYGSLLLAKLGGREQIVGHDRTTLGGWDPKTGERLWTVTPPRAGDFNVPTPCVYDGKLLVTTEGNGTRLYTFDGDGKASPQPAAQQMALQPDMSTPVVVGDRAYCVCQKLFCLDLANDLAELWSLEDPALGDYAPILADDERLLILGHGGELLLVDITGPEPKITSRTFLFDDPETREAELYSHPAVVGNALYVRGETSLARFELGE